MTLHWHQWKLPVGHTLVGNIQISTLLKSKFLGNERILYVYLPPSYAEGDNHYPVLYMHDGQNLFDDTLSHSGEWCVDETMEMLSGEGMEAIIVGVPNADQDRAQEYTPYTHPEFGGGKGATYLKFLVEEVKPIIDVQFRTQPERASTGLMGSSLGGLISLYAFFQYPEVFSFAGVMSPAFWFNQADIFDFVQQAPFVDGAIYMDVGTHETPDNPALSEYYVTGFKDMAHILQEKGYTEPSCQFIVAEGAIHHEREWAKRLPNCLRFWWKRLNLSAK